MSNCRRDLVDDLGVSDRREILRKIMGAVAGTGISAVLLSRLTQLAPASNVVPSSGTATFDGPVGIGTASPAFALDVAGSTMRVGIGGTGSDLARLFLNSGADTAAVAQVTGMRNGAVVWSFCNASNSTADFLLDFKNTFQLRSIDNSYASAISVLASGMVGIGTTSPSQKLTVAGDVGQTASANGLVKAAALVNGSGSIIRSFNNLPGGSGPTVTQPIGPGTYEVNFGANVAQRFFSATPLSSNSTDPGGASDGQVLVSARDGNVNAVFVRTNDSTGTSTNRSFYLMVF